MTAMYLSGARRLFCSSRYANCFVAAVVVEKESAPGQWSAVYVLDEGHVWSLAPHCYQHCVLQKK